MKITVSDFRRRNAAKFPARLSKRPAQSLPHRHRPPRNAVAYAAALEVLG